MFLLAAGPSRTTVPYTTFYQQLQSANVKDLNAVGNSLQGDFKKPVTVGSVSGTAFQTERPVFATDDVMALLQQQNVPVTAQPVSTGSALLSLLLGFGPPILLVAAFICVSRHAAG